MTMPPFAHHPIPTLLAAALLACASTGFSASQNPDPGAALDLTPLHDATRILANPHKGWYHHFPDNHPNRYPIERDSDLLDIPGMDHLYIRLAWSYLEPEEGQYKWDVIDPLIEKWTAKGLGISFRVCCKETSVDRVEQRFATPQWVMAAGAKGGFFRMGKPTTPDGAWEVDYGDPVFIAKLDKFLQAFAARYDGKPWLRYVDIGSIGDWGEGHTWAGSRKELSFAVRKTHVDLYLKHFRHSQLVISDDYVHSLGNLPERANLHQYILANGISYRDDSIMVDGTFADSGPPDQFTVRSPEFFESSYRATPTVLELEHYGKIKSLGNWDARPGSAASKYAQGRTGPEIFRGAIGVMHATYIGYHGDARTWLTENPELTRELLNRCGYWLFPKSLVLPSELAAGQSAPLTLCMENHGVAAPYAPYQLRLRLSAPGRHFDQVLAQGCKAWLPGTPVPSRYQLTLPSDLSTGDYDVALGLFDVSGKQERPVEFALKASTRDPEGYYKLAKVTVTPAVQARH